MNTVLLKKSVTSLRMPSEMQERIIQKCRAHIEPNLNNESYSRPRRVVAIACTFIIVLVLALCIFPLPIQNSNGQFKFHLAGLIVSAYADEVSNGYMEWNIQMLEKFDSINITVSDGYLSKNKDAITGDKELSLSGSETFYWFYNKYENSNLFIAGRFNSKSGSIKADFIVEKLNTGYTPIIQYFESRPRFK